MKYPCIPHRVTAEERERLGLEPHPPTSPVVAISYHRVSTEEQKIRGFSLPEQWEATRAEAIRAGATLIYRIDDDIAGDILDRPGLNTARDLARSGEAHLFVCLDPDRFARKLSLQLTVADELERRLELRFVDQEYRKTPEGILFFQLKGAIAEYERSKILERTRRGRIGKAKSGGLPQHVACYGYTQPAGEGSLLIHPDQARWVKQIYTWAATERLSARAIAERLNAMRVEGARGGRWGHSQVARLIARTTYKGLFFAGQWDSRGVGKNRYLRREERVRPKRRPADEWIPVPVPAIVTEELWEAANAAQAGARRRQCGARKGAHLLRGLLRCGLCGRPMSGHTKRTGGKEYRYYRCRAMVMRSAETHCASRSIPAMPLEQAVWTMVSGWLLLPEALALSPASPRSGLLQQELDYLTLAMERAREAQARVVGLVARGVLTDERAVGEALADIERETALQQRRRAEIESRLRQRTPSGEGLREQICRKLPNLSFEQRRHLVRLLIQEIDVIRNRVQMQVNLPPSLLGSARGCPFVTHLQEGAAGVRLDAE